MSAKNWSVCPRCKAHADAAKKDREKQARDAYGKVSPEQYEGILARSREPVTYLASLREDYQLGITEDGVFCVVYRASCEECIFEHEFKHEVKLNVNLNRDT